jgi:transcriptional regulator with XRE-family HTH domain
MEGEGRAALEQFRHEFERLRRRSDLTWQAVASRAACSVPWLRAIEQGRRNPTVELAAALDEIFGTSPLLEDLARAIEAAKTPPWFGRWAALEADAVQLWLYEPLLVPGLFQTKAYAYEVAFEEPDLSPDQVDDLVSARTERQAILTRPRPPVVMALIDGRVLDRPVGGPKVMAEQLDYLADLAERRNITVQVMPPDMGAYCCLAAGFAIAEDAKGRKAVYLDALLEGYTRATPGAVQAVSMRLDRARAAAHPAGASLEYIRERATYFGDRT